MKRIEVCYLVEVRPDEKIYIAGHRGLAGRAIWRHLEENRYTNLVGFSSDEVDLADKAATMEMMRTVKPDVVVDAAALVGGIQANKDAPVDFLHQNLRIQMNLMDASHQNGVERFLFLGSSCAYPKHAPQPIRESSLLAGRLEETNIGYAMAKLAGVIGIDSFRKQHNRRWISAMPTNLYGPYDNYSPESSHVLAAFIRRFHESKVLGRDHVKIWGTGAPLREFLHSDDLAAAVLFLLQNYDDPEIVNVGSGKEISIVDLARLVSDIVGFKGRIECDTSKPDGTPRKMVDSSKLMSLGWTPQRELREGISEAYDWFLRNHGAMRA